MLKNLCSALCCCLLFFVSSALAEPLPVLVSIMPQKWLAEQVGGELVKVSVLLDKGQDPHGMQPTPEQVTTLFRSKVYFSVGLEFERELLAKIKQSEAKVRVADISAGVQKIAMTEHEHGHFEQEEAHFGGLDPHIWLNPQNLQRMAATIAAALKEADAANAAAYEKNLQTVTAALTTLDADLKTVLAPFKGQTFLVYHPAFGYFAKAYGLRQAAVEIEGKSPAPKQLYDLISRAKNEKAKVIFVQPQFDRKNGETVAKAIGGRVAVLDPMAENVPENLHFMAKEISAALGGKE
ncbi:metal ABC transporter solute-binding protein, Zn/Mn family [Candidatus Electronema sp. JM]|uniref:metal ABC transporter solute-binding protein, Zn/Mn family n=1 Tax=Candidatus Electronema sp. JM TaxID=3401571 RepID=UPI003AA822FB